jgi:hypothetical protein
MALKKDRKNKKVKPETPEQWMELYTSEWEFFTTHSDENQVKAKISGVYCLFRPNRPLIPILFGHRFRCKSATLSGLNRPLSTIVFHAAPLV